MAARRKHYIYSRSGLGRKPKLQIPEKIDTHIVHNNPEIKRIQGIWPDSKEEYWVALALWKLHIDFVYQYQLWGGRRYKGGQVIDFWVYTMPLPTPILVQGWHWHYATAEKAARTRTNIMYLESRLNGKAMKPVEIITTDIPDPETTYMVVKKKLKR